MGDKPNIYFAAALFSGRETFFNVHLADRLETSYDVFLPQRDGFEFGRLTGSLKDKMNAGAVSEAVQSIIYMFDMGVMLPKHKVVVANLDEPLDPGVDVEVSYAKQMGKFVVGFRTDVRSPYGSISDALRGIHFFPAYQCNVFIPHYMPAKCYEDAEQGMNDLAAKIESAITANKRKIVAAEDNLSNPVVQKVIQGARILFDGISDPHSQESLDTIAERYVVNKRKLSEIGPEILK